MTSLCHHPDPLYTRFPQIPALPTISMRPSLDKGHQLHMERATFPSSPSSSSSSCGGVKTALEETPVVVIGRRGCCMGHVMKHLLQGLGVSPVVWEIDGEAEETLLRAELGEMGWSTGEEGRGFPVTLPVVFIGGRLVGGLDHLLAAHISGDLVPNLKEAGALWL